MSVPTQAAFIHHGPWDDESRSHPITKFFEEYIKEVIDGGGFKNEQTARKHQTEDYLLVLSDGKTFQGVDAVWKAAPAVFEPFSAYKHFPVLMVVWQEKGSWVVFGFAHWFFNLQAPLPENVTDPDGGKWVGVANLGFKFGFAQKGDEIKMNETRLFTDPSPALRLLLQNKLVDGEGVAKIIMTG